MTPEEVRDLRGDLTRAAFADIVGVTPLTVYRWELPTDEKESRRPQRRFRRVLKDLVEHGVEEESQVEVPPSSEQQQSVQRDDLRRVGDEMTPTERTIIEPIFAQVLNAEWRKAENSLMSAFSSGRLVSESARVLAQAASGMLKLLWRNDVRGAYSSFGPTLRRLAENEFSSEVMVPAHTLAAMIFSSPDGRVFNPGRVNRHVALAERHMGDDEYNDFRVLLRTSEMWAAYHLDDADLHNRLRLRNQDVFKLATTTVARWSAWEIGTIAAYLSGCVAEADRFLTELVQEARKAGIALIAARGAGLLSQVKLFGNESLESIADLVEEAQQLIWRERIEPGFAGILLDATQAEILCRRGKFENAMQYIEGSLERAREIQWPPLELFFTHMRLSFLLSEGDIAQLAERYASFEGGHRRTMLSSIRHVSSATSGLAELDMITASSEFERAGSIAADAGTFPALQIFCQVLSYYAAVLSRNRGRADVALRRVEQSLEKIPLFWMTNALKLFRALDMALQGHISEAAQLSEAAQTGFARVEDQAQLLFTSRLRAVIASVLDEPDAEDRLQNSAQRFEEMGVPVPRPYRREAIERLKKSRPAASKACQAMGLNKLAIPIDRLAVHGLNPSQILAELGDVLQRFARTLDGDAVWIDELGSGDRIIELHRTGSGEPVEFVEFGDGCGRRFRVGVLGPLNHEQRTALSIFTRVTSLSMEVASLRALTNPAGSSVSDSVPELPGLIAASDAIRELVKEVARLGKSRANVLIQGESGAGKEVIAHAVHKLSNRSGKSFVTFNCAAVPRDLFEGQLFGYKRGSFTGATTDHPGVIRAADGGTLFLDEIGDLPLDVQPKLLRFLENGEVFPLGETRPAKVDVRVIAATHRNLQEMVRDREFREDLYFRLAVVLLEVPPLRERREDILALARHFIELYLPEDEEVPRLAAEAAQKLMEHRWPGNVRELRNVIERSLAYSPLPEVLTTEDLRF